jgi:hypothetical protein
MNRNSERIPRRFCLTAVLRGLRGIFNKTVTAENDTNLDGGKGCLQTGHLLKRDIMLWVEERVWNGLACGVLLPEA